MLSRNPCFVLVVAATVLLSKFLLAQARSPNGQPQPGQAAANFSSGGPQQGQSADSSRELEGNQTAANMTVPASARAPKLRLGPGDEMDITVFGVPDLTQHARVSTEGDIYFAPLGWIPVAGSTVEEAQGRIESRLLDGNFLTHPQVGISVKEYTSQAVSVIGEVAKPGIYTVLGPHTVLDVLLMAGGLGQKAGNTVTITHRDHLDEPVKVKIGFDLQSLDNKTAEILPGDVVSVSRAGIVYIIGEVNRPGGFVMENEKMRLAEAVALAAGPTHAAALNGTKMLRKTPTGVQEITVPLKKVLQAKIPDMDLRPDDIIFIPASLGKSIASHTSQAVLSMATTAAIYRP